MTTDQIKSGGELLPCPFCGGEAKRIFRLGRTPFIECQKCGIEQSGHTHAEAVAAWNSRTPSHGRVSDSEDGRLPDGTGLPMNGAAKASPPSVGIPDATLLPCPFCGTNECAAQVWGYDDDTLEREDWTATAWGVDCSCAAAVGPFYTEDEAVAAWNKRTAIAIEARQGGDACGSIGDESAGRQASPETDFLNPELTFSGAPIPVEGEVEALVKEALSIATYGTPADIAVQIATNAVRTTLARRLTFSRGVDEVREALERVDNLIFEQFSHPGTTDPKVAFSRARECVQEISGIVRAALSTIEEPRA